MRFKEGNNMENNFLSVTGIRKSFGSVEVLKGISDFE